ncbi:MAG: glycosyltransferase family 4 protein [Candidatus Pristimantibacillus sp.]
MRRRKAASTVSKLDTENRQQGINIIGFINAEMGIGESSRLAARAIETTDIPFGLINYPLKIATSMNDMSWAHKTIEAPLYNTNVYHLNADFMTPALEHFGHSLFSNRYNIGYWHWELPDFPDEYVPAFKLVQEVWVCSNFVSESVARKSTVPVVTIPHGIQVQFDPEMNRSSFALPENQFLFLMMYDLQSSTMRKNPEAVIQAFKLAFDSNDTRVGLVLKVNNLNSRPDDLLAIRQLISQQSNIHLIDKGLSRIEVNSLLNCTDCFVSLHRAEGFGLGLAEAMYLGKPVIGTNWSGNTDFMNDANSCPVSYKLVQVGQDWGPYKGYQTWADPSVSHAADYMRRVVNDPEWRNEIAANGKTTIHNDYSPEAVGQKIKARLTELSLV